MHYLKVLNKIHPVSYTHLIKGGEGNIEFLVHIGYNENMRTNVYEKDIIQIVSDAHSQL